MIVLRSCISADNDFKVLPYFIKHYLNHGVENFKIVINSKKLQSKELNIVREIFKQYNITIEKEWIGPYSEYKRLDLMNQVLENVNDEDWVVSVDGDEFHQYEMKVNHLIKKAEEQNCDLIKGAIIDKISSNQRVVPFQSEIELEKQFPLKANLHSLKQKKQCIQLKHYEGCFQPKIVLHKKKVKLGEGFHQIRNDQRNNEYKIFSDVIEVHHYKWYDDVLQKMKRITKEDQLSERPNFANKNDIIKYLEKNYNIPIISK